MSPIRAVWFDVGEILINETREYGTWADWLGIPRHTFSAVFGAVIARGEDYREVFRYFRPDFDLESARQARLDEGLGEYLNGHDLYPDVRPYLQAFKDAGYFVGIAGNQTTRAGQFLRELNLPCDVLATSDDWGLTKPRRSILCQADRRQRPSTERDRLRGGSPRQRPSPCGRGRSAHRFRSPWSVGLHPLRAWQRGAGTRFT
jgi:FMN phosphatase YigB (HAD superfamily)